MLTALRRLTDAERAAFVATSRAFDRCQKLVKAGEVQCDRCDLPAVALSASAGALDCSCRACFPAVHAEAVAAARAAAWY